MSRWLNWEPKERIFGNSLESAPPKPTKLGSVGFVGATLAESSEIEAKNRGAQAVCILNRSGVRIMQLNGISTIGIWLEVDSPEIRRALCALGYGQWPVRFLDEDGIPDCYKVRRRA